MEPRAGGAPKGTSTSSQHRSSPLAKEPPPERKRCVSEVTHTLGGVNGAIPSRPPTPRRELLFGQNKV